MSETASNEPAALATAKQLLKRRDYQAAINVLSAAVETDVDNAQLHEGLATAYFLKGDLQESLDSFEKVTRLAPGRGTALINMGAVYNRLGDHAKAATVLRKGVQREKKSAQGFYNLGIAQKGLNQLSMAASAYKEAIKLAPEMSEAHQNLGNIYLEMGNNRQAIACFRKALEFRPDFPRAQRGLAKAESAIDQAKAAVSPFGRLVDEEELNNREVASAARELTPQERYDDRKLIYGYTRVVRDAAQTLAMHLNDQFVPALLGLNRAVSHSDGGREMATAYDAFRAAVETSGELHNQLTAQISVMREHEQQLAKSE